MKRFIALVDCDSFFVSCEQAKNPLLKNKPVCVIGSTDGCVLSRSKEAKKAGVKMGMPYFMAKNEFKNVIYVCANMSLYKEFSDKVMKCLKQFTPDMEQYSVDEAFLDITGCEKLYKRNYFEIIQMIKDEVKKQTDIPVSIGLSSSKTLAKLASDMAKSTPQGVLKIDDCDIEKILKNIKIEDIWGIGRNHTKLLKQRGILTGYDFVSLSDELIKKELGILGFKLKCELLGKCMSKVDSSEKIPESIQKTASFKKASSDISFIKKELKKHIHSACLKLRKHDASASSIGVMLRTKDFKIAYQKCQLLNPVCFEIEVSKIADKLLKEIFCENTLYRSTGIVLSKFTVTKIRQTSLFDDEKLQKNITLAQTLDKIEEKFGKNSISVGF